MPDGVDASLECTASTCVCGRIGAAAFGTEVTLDMNGILVNGSTVRGIVEGDSVPAEVLPRLTALREQGRSPMERIMTFYDFDDIDRAAHDAEAGRVSKPMLRMGTAA